MGADVPGKVRLTAAAERDLRRALDRSAAEFGIDAVARYRMLLSRAIKEIGADPFRPGSNAEDEVARGVRTYHIRLSRDRARSTLGIVRNPRHILVYRVHEKIVELLRVVHDAQDLDELGLKP